MHRRYMTRVTFVDASAFGWVESDANPLMNPGDSAFRLIEITDSELVDQTVRLNPHLCISLILASSHGHVRGTFELV